MKQRQSSGRHQAEESEKKSSTAYLVTLVRSAEKELLALPDDRFDSVTEHLELLKGNPRPPGSAKLSGRHEYKFRVGDIRIIYEVHDNEREVVIVMIDDRKQVYRRLKKRK
jgi:mRNA interferase RelE/StbE